MDAIKRRHMAAGSPAFPLRAAGSVYHLVRCQRRPVLGRNLTPGLIGS